MIRLGFYCLCCCFFLSGKEDTPKKEIYKFKLIEDRICVELRLNDSITGIFAIDNEANCSLIDSSLLSKLENKKGIKEKSLKINLANLVANETFLSVDSKIEPFAVGIIGKQIFLNRIFAINFSDSTISFYDSLPQHKEYYKLPYYRLRSKKSSEYGIDVLGFCDADNNPIKAKFMIDLGARFTLKLTLAFSKHISSILKKDFKTDTLIIGNSYDSEANQKIIFSYYYIDSIFLSDLKIRNIKTSNESYIDGKDDRYSFWEPASFDGVFGIKFLKDFDVIFDYKNGYLYLKPIKKTIKCFKNKI